ncbi:hypothetical protein F3J34_14000 [Klebsiella sp. Ap-873]|nr:hypothetical protein [Klebsiella sp. Ap-873]
MSQEFNPEATPDGIRIGNRLVGYSIAIKQLDSGQYDDRNYEGSLILGCIQFARESRWLKPTTEQEIILWRWLVVTVFLNEESEKNGTAEIPNAHGGTDTAVIYAGKNGAISVYPGPLRLALASNAEGAVIEKYGVDEGSKLSLRMYQDWVEIDEVKGFRLSAIGREGLEILHDSYIEDIKTNGMPETPVIH